MISRRIVLRDSKGRIQGCSKVTAQLKGGEYVHVFIPEGHAILRQGEA